MEQVCSPEQTGPIRSSPNGINRFVLEKKQPIFSTSIVLLPRHDFLLQSECVRKLYSAKPERAEGIHSSQSVYRSTYDPQTPVQRNHVARNPSLANHQTSHAIRVTVAETYL